MDNKKIIIQTIQPISVLNEIENLGICYSIPDFSTWDNSHIDSQWGFFHAYEWMKEQMIYKNIHPTKNENHLFWGWIYSNDLNKKNVDLRTRKGSKGNVLLTIEKSMNEVLLSEFSFWHFVLNYWALSKTKEEEIYWDNISKTYNYYRDKPILNSDLNTKIEKTWDIIFDIQEKNDIYSFYKLSNKEKKYLEIGDSPLTVQGTFWNIQSKDIINIQHINN